MIGGGRRQVLTFCFSITGIVWASCATAAGPEPYDIDLKDLWRPPIRRNKEKPPPRQKTAPSPVSPHTEKPESTYIVQPGDHLFLILMRRYGLPNNTAEQLIPEIMRLNSIRNPRDLSVGQRLTIPLLPATEMNNGTKTSETRQKQRHASSASAPVKSTVMSTPHVREVTPPPARPCAVAREVASQLGVRVSSFLPLLDEESTSVSYGTRKVAVVCSLSHAEKYTLERVLARQDIKLLAFAANDAPHTVIETLAGNLGITLELADSSATSTGLPHTYLFPAFIEGSDLLLTIRPEAPAAQ